MKHIRRQKTDANSEIKNNSMRQRLMKTLAPLVKRRSARLLIIVSGFIAVAVAAQFVSAVLRESEASQSVQPAALVAPITATKSATIATDNNGNGHVNPGDVIEYSVTVGNGGTPASGVIFSDMLSSELTLVPGSVKAAPVAGDDSYQTIGNTQLQVAATQTISSPGIFVNGNVLSNDNDPNGGTLSASAGATSTNGGTVAMNADGTFTYTPPVGFTGTDTFTYNLADTPNDGFTVTGTVTINVLSRVWYVKNNQAAGGLGRSSDPFDTLLEADTASAAGDTIYVFNGTGTTAGQSLGVSLKANQRLIGEGVALTVPVSVNGGPNPTTLRAAGTQPMIDNTTAGGSGVSVPNNAGVEIQGLNIAGNTNAIDATYSSASGGLTIANNTIRSAGAEGIDVNIGGGTINVAISSNTVTSTGNGIDINRTSGTASITAFSGNTVTGNTGGIGVNIVGTGATIVFDSNTGTGAFDTVSGGNTAVGASGNGVGTSGMVLSNVRGDLSFSDLDIYADNGNALLIDSTTSNFNAGTGTGFRFVANTNTPTLVSTNGAALSATETNINIVLNLMTSANSAGTGVSLVETSGTFSAPSGSSITNATGVDFFIDGNDVATANVSSTYGGTITDDVGTLVQITDVSAGTNIFSGAITDGDDGDGSGVSITSNTGGTTHFSGGLVLNTGANPAFAATTNTGATVEVCDENPCNSAATGALINKITTTTGTALNVANTNIGANKLEFRSISANGSSNGIVLNTTGSSGGLTVTGGGSVTQGGDNSGGTIQNTTGYGISLTSTTGPSFNNVRLLNTGDSGVNGTQVNGFIFTNGTITGAGNASDENSITFDDSLTSTPNLTGVVTITNNIISQTEAEGIDILNFAGTISDANISNNALSDTGDVATPGSAISLIGSGTATSAATITKATIANNTITDFRAGVGVQVRAGNPNAGAPTGSAGTAGSATNVIAVTGNFMNGGNGGIGNQPDRFFTGGVSGNGGQGNFNVSNNGTAANRLRMIDCIAIEVQMDGPVTMTSTVSNNFINANSAVGCAGIAVGTDDPIDLGAGNHSTLISNNNVMGTDGPGIFPIVRDSNSTMIARVINNTVAAPIANAARAGIRVDSGSASGDTTMCLEITGNITAGSTNSDTGTTSPGINLRKQGTDPAVNTFGIEGMGATASPGVENYVNGLNTSTSGTFGVGGTALLSATSGFSNCTAPFAKLGNPKTHINEYLSLDTSYRSPFEMLTSQSSFKHSDNIQTISTNQTVAFVKAGNQAVIENTFVDYKESAGLAVSQNQSTSGNFNAVYRLTSALYNTAKYFALFDFIPTTHAEESEASALMAGETVCVDGDTSSGPPCNGPGFNLPANKSTTIKFRATVNASTTATSVNNTANVIAAGGINVNSNTTNTPIVRPPGITKSFSPTSVAVNGTSTLTLSITNPNPTNLTGVAVTDNFPANLVIAATPMLTTTGCGAGTVTDPTNGALGAGDTGIKITGATVASGTPCVVTVKVTPTTEGDKVNTTDAVTSTNGGTGLTASATLGSVAAPSFTKSFGATTLAVGATTTLTFNITNNSTTTALTNVSFTDTLPGGLVVGTPNNLTGSCGGGTITATANSGSIQLAGATLAASASCSFTVDVKGTTSGTKNNTVDLATNQTGTGPTATDSLDVFVKPNVFVRDAKAAEPATGSTNMIFTVTLSQVTTQNVTVNFTTAPDTGGANPATTGTDYTMNSGNVIFFPGQQVKTISVPVLADGAVPVETDETFLVNLTSATNGDISDGQAVGTITQGSTPGAVLISELRTSGPGGAGDDYVEIYNNSDAPLTVAASDASAGWAVVVSNNGCIDDPVIVGVIPNGTVIPARGHYLFVGSQYSLSNYGGTSQATGNLTMTEDINPDANVALFTTADPVNLSTVNRRDAVGFGLNTVDVCDLLREGTTLNGATSSTSEHAFVRKYDEGVIVDTGDNAADFQVVTTTPAMPVGNNATPSLGAPGPQSLASPLESVPCGMTIGFERDLLDPMVAAGASQNRVRTGTGNSGTLSIRRKFTNNSGGNITRLRFRFYDLTTAPAMAGTADLRSTTSTDTTVTITSGMVTVRGTTLETPPAQANGGGINSTLSAGAITLGTPLANGASINAQFLFNVNQAGNYRMGVMVEGLPGLGSQERWILEGNTETQTDTETGCNQPPDTTIDSSPSNPSNSSSASFNFSGTDADGTVASFQCKLDGGSFTACASPQNYSSLTDGSHTFQVRAIDNLGAVDETPASFTWTIDTVAPDTTINTNPTNPSTGNVNFTFSGTDAGTGVAGFECRLDGGAFASCTSPQNYPGLTDGSHTFEVRAIDGAGNVDASPASYTWTVDATPPDTTINSNPSNPSNSSSASFTFSGTDSGSGVASFECKLDAGSFVACTSPQNYSSLSEGSHTFQVRAIDVVGNVDPTPASFTWVVDTIAPNTTIDSNPTNPSASSTASFTFSGTDPGGTGVASFECKLDGGAFAACTSPQTYNSLADGSHTFQVRAIDGAGNTDATPASFTWTIDTAPPDTSITANPTDPSGANVSFSFSGTDAGTGVESFECKLDGGSFAACTSPQSYTNLSQGSHTFQVRAIDGIGNVDPTPASFTWTVDATPPDTSINTSPPNPSNSGNASFTFSGTDSGGSTVASFECSLDGGPFAACASPQNYSSLADGSHTFQVRAIDGVGNVDASPASYTWVVDTTGPDTTITANPPNPSNSNSASFSFTGTDTGGSGVASFECQLDGGGFTACTSPQTYNSLSDGSHTFQVRAIDNAGNVDPTPASFTWTVDTAPPDTTINTNPPNPTNSTSASFTFSGTDSGTGVASFECKLDGGAFAACTSPQNYSGLSNGSHTFQVRAIDGIGNVDPTPASYTWTVDTVSPNVSINQASGQSDPANGMGIQIHFTAVFNEPVTGFNSASDVTVSGTAGATTVVITEIAPMNGTTYDVAVSGMTSGGTVIVNIPANKANDAAGNGNNASTSTDNQVTYVPNTPPTAVADGYSTVQDTPLNVPPPGVLSNDSDPDAGNTITAVLVSGPTNAASFTLNANGSFNYTPTAGFTGTDSFTYKARDNFNADSNTVTVTINVQFKFNWFSYGGVLFNENTLNQVTAGSDVPVRFTLYGYKGNPYSSPPTSEPISCATFASTGAATVINRYAPDPMYHSTFDFYQTTWKTQASWKFTCRRLTLYLTDGTTKSLNFYFK